MKYWKIWQDTTEKSSLSNKEDLNTQRLAAVCEPFIYKILWLNKQMGDALFIVNQHPYRNRQFFTS